MTWTAGPGAERSAMARAIIQPMQVQPRTTLTTATAPMSGTWRIQAITSGSRYSPAEIVMMTIAR
jgi:predicted NAD/FAD-dependent oxidoreductase